MFRESQVPQEHGLIAGLPVWQRLALAYAPAATRPAWTVLMALDTRLAGVVRSASEPMIAQIRLAWWRERLVGDPRNLPKGEPLLAMLGSWNGHAGDLAALVDGWEAMTGEAPLPAQSFAALADARGQAFSALSRVLGCEDSAGTALRFGHDWALVDIAGHLSDGKERDTVWRQIAARDWSGVPLPRAMRPLGVLRGVAARCVRHDTDFAESGPLAMLTAMRIGLTGR